MGKKEQILSEVCMMIKKEHLILLYNSDVMKKYIF